MLIFSIKLVILYFSCLSQCTNWIIPILLLDSSVASTSMLWAWLCCSMLIFSSDISSLWFEPLTKSINNLDVEFYTNKNTSKLSLISSAKAKKVPFPNYVCLTGLDIFIMLSFVIQDTLDIVFLRFGLFADSEISSVSVNNEGY